MGHNVRIIRPGDQCWEQPAQHDDFGAPERWSESNPCDSQPTGSGPGGGAVSYTHLRAHETSAHL
eukprot:9127382-Alexandrium_andersonii.AAC.1